MTVNPGMKDVSQTCSQSWSYNHNAQNHRNQQRLVTLYKVVDGLAPANAQIDYLIPSSNKRQVRTKQNNYFVSSNIVERQQTKKQRSFQLTNSNTNIPKRSFFPRTVIDWNHLKEEKVRAKTVDSFINALLQCV